ncbi:MAG: multidrug effflux MFS transporter [Proteobacteria bacterium]|nr:multidrug effflux MFS transporter [Pseudomonadota bacterium]
MNHRLSDGQIVAFVTVLIAIAQLSTSIYLPSLPALVEVFGTDAAMVQLTFTVYMLGAAVSQLAVGPLSDRFGRRPVLLAGLAVYVLASVLAALAPTVEALIAARLLQSIGATAGPVVGRAIVRDCFDRAHGARVMANVGMALAVSPAVAPLIGAYVHESLGWRANFVLVAAFGVTIAVISALYLAETNRNIQAGAGVGALARNYGLLLRSRAFLVYAMTTSCVFGGMFAFLGEGPFLLMGLLGASPKEYALLSAIPVGGFVVGSALTSKWTLRIGIDRMILMGLALAVVSVAVLIGFAVAGVFNFAVLIGPVTMVVMAMGLVFPNGTAGALSAHPEIAGTASALLGFFQMGFAGLAVLVTSILTGETQIPMIAVMSGAVAAAVLSFSLRPELPPRVVGV